MTPPLPSPLIAAPGAGVPEVRAAPLGEWFDEGDLAAARRYRRGTWALGAAGMLVGPLTIAGLVATGPRWRRTVGRATGARPLPAALAFGAGLSLAGDLARLPLGLARYGWGRRFGLVTQPAGSWLADRAKAAAIGTVLTSGLAGSTAAAMRRWPRAWWLGTWGVVTGGGVALAFAGPRLIEPLFQKVRPLDDPALERDVRLLAERLGVPVRDVVVSDASRRTTASNAYVSGLGATRRVVLFDTLLRDFPPDQVRFVVAHELAHVARRHVARGAGLSAAAALPALGAVASAVAVTTGTGRVGGRGAELVLRRLTVATAAAGAVGTLAGRLARRMSLGFEREADWEALRATGDSDAAIGLHRGLVQRNLGVPDPPAWVQRLWGTHPTPLERIGLALRFRSGG